MKVSPLHAGKEHGACWDFARHIRNVAVVGSLKRPHPSCYTSSCPEGPLYEPTVTFLYSAKAANILACAKPKPPMISGLRCMQFTDYGLHGFPMLQHTCLTHNL